MAGGKSVQIVCANCGMQAEVRLEAAGPRYFVTDIASSSKCRYDWRGMSVLECSGLKSELSRVSALLSQENG
jgi:hypothetical protein